MKSVLFLCTRNSARSQMAEALLRHYHGSEFKAFSAGTVPGEVHPLAIKVMAEMGIDISGYRSKSVEEFRGRRFDIVVTVCDSARETCPFFPGDRVIHRSFPDPAAVRGDEAEMLGAFREVRDRIREFVEELAAGTF